MRTQCGTFRISWWTAAFAILFVPVNSFADITLDGTLGRGGALAGPNYAITAGMGRQVGRNLFHSFGRFNLTYSESATFRGPASVNTIIARVTGGERSNIDGLIRSEIRGANLFFTNPAGIIFGPHAALDISGSFHAGTADYIKLGSSGRFDAAMPDASVLTVDPPSAFGFLRRNPADIRFQGTGSYALQAYSRAGKWYWQTANGAPFAVSPGNSLTFSAGNIYLESGALFGTVPVESRLLAPGGGIALTAVSSAGKVPFTPRTASPCSVSRFGTIGVTGGSYLDASDGGSIVIRGGRFIIDNGVTGPLYPYHPLPSGVYAQSGGEIDISVKTLKILNGGQISGTAFSADRGADITVNASDAVFISGNGGGSISSINNHSEGKGDAGTITVITPLLRIDQGGVVSGASAADAGGRGADVTLRIGRLELIGGGHVDTSTLGAGQAGTVSVSAAESIAISGFTGEGKERVDSGISSFSNGSGAAGTMEISTPKLSIRDGVLTVFSTGTGNAGRLFMDLGSMDMAGGGWISAGAYSAGAGGTITIRAAESLTMRGTGKEGETNRISGNTDSINLGSTGADISITTPILRMDSGGSITTICGSGGKAGNISLDLGRLSLAGGAFVGAGSIGAGNGGNLRVAASESVAISGYDRLGPSGLFTSSGGEGDAGNIFVKTPFLAMRDKGKIGSSANGSGNGGSIGIETGTLDMNAGALIAAESRGNGNAGDIRIAATDRMKMLGSSVTAAAADGDGGNIGVAVKNMMYLRDSDITASVQGGTGNGGNIAIDPRYLVLNTSSIVADAAGGRGGNIAISAGAFVPSAGSVVSASSRLGIDGTVVITAPVRDINTMIKALNPAYLDREEAAPTLCRGRNGRSGSFVVKGRDGLPPRPDALLSEQPVLPETGGDEITALMEKGDYRNALVAARADENVFREKGDSGRRIAVLLRMAEAYQAVGRYGEGFEKAETARKVMESENRPELRPRVIACLARSLMFRNRLADAEALLGQALAVRGYVAGEKAGILNHQGNLHVLRGKYRDAVAAYHESASLAEKGGDSRLAAAALANEARALVLTGDSGNAGKAVLAALTGYRNLHPSRSKSYGLINVSATARRMAEGAAGEKSRFREIARTALEEALASAESVSDGEAASYARGYLGLMLEQDGEYSRALDVTNRALYDALERRVPELVYLWQWQNGRILRARGTYDEALSAYRSAVRSFGAIRGEIVAEAALYNKTSGDESVEAVYRGLADMLLTRADRLGEGAPREAILGEALQTVDQLKRTELENYFRDPCVAEKSPEPVSTQHVPAGMALMYPIILPDRLELLVKSGEGIGRFTVPVGAAILTEEVRAFRESLEDGGGRRYLPHARKLYDWIVRPAEAVLSRLRIDTLVFIPYGPLHTIPPAALHDGTDFLVSRFATAVIPAASLAGTRAVPRQEKKLLVAGLSEPSRGFAPLYYVEKELGVLHDLFPGMLLRNEAFRASLLRKEMESERFTSVHIASHGVFAEDSGGSYIVAWDGRLSMDDVENLMAIGETKGEPVDLLTLSACETAAGSDRAALGLAGIAVKAGVRNALATLWSINDQPGYTLVTEFYRQLRKGAGSHAKALQRAQVKMLSDRKFRHPGNWSQFIYVGEE